MDRLEYDKLSTLEAIEIDYLVQKVALDKKGLEKKVSALIVDKGLLVGKYPIKKVVGLVLERRKSGTEDENTV